MLTLAMAKQVWDVRSLKRTGEIKDAHLMPIRAVDFAHQQQHRIVTGGDDCQVCVWDLRYAPVVVRVVLESPGHGHNHEQTDVSLLHITVKDMCSL